jgi:peptidoglycan hydrolase-like protein with peptidoglycan-binding domain
MTGAPAIIEELGTEAPRRRRRRRRVRTLVVAGTTAVAVVGVTAAALGFGGRDGGGTAHRTLPPATAKVVRATLTETEDVDGKLGYGTATAITLRGQGTVTWLPAAGATVSRGRPICSLDGHPVVLLYGSLPFYRALAPGVKGDDVRQFEQNLAALGYTGFTVDDVYNAATAAAVKDWQGDLGLDKTGTVAPGAVVYAPGPIRVNELKAQVGDPAGGGPLLTWTGTTRQVSIALDTAKQNLVKAGAAVTVRLPDGSTAAGKIASVASAARTVGTGDQATSVIDVVVSLDDQSKLGTYNEAPVKVTLVVSSRENVLAVPVDALLALAEGGYGVQVVEGGAAHIVAVKTGLFANGRVEVSGDGISEGTLVGVPK